MLRYLRKLTGSEDGASAVEYGLLVAAIAAVIVAVVFVLGGLIEEAFTDTCESIEGSGTIAAENC